MSYRLGYLCGTLRAYESEDDIRGLVEKSKNLIDKAAANSEATEKNSYKIKGKNGEDIIL